MYSFIQIYIINNAIVRNINLYRWHCSGFVYKIELHDLVQVLYICVDKSWYIHISAVKFQISNIFFSVRFKSLIFGYLERFYGLKSFFKFSCGSGIMSGNCSGND